MDKCGKPRAEVGDEEPPELEPADARRAAEVRGLCRGAEPAAGRVCAANSAHRTLDAAHREATRLERVFEILA